ncbi:MAG: NYN domain-containing protein [Lachnospiraceae bacterium]|nr:NYN domain-containing protein [Lachnospiraceae bacterium]
MFQDNDNPKLAILIDAENISPRYIAMIMREASVIGTVKYKRIYGNFSGDSLNSWERAISENAMIPIQQYNNTKGKNSSDSALIIDAMDLLYTGSVDGFCLITSDSDFTRLATRLRESEKYVIGMGEQKAAKSFINACNRFIYLDLLMSQEKKNQKSKRKSGGTQPAPQQPAYSPAEKPQSKAAKKPTLQKPHAQGEGEFTESGNEDFSGQNLDVVRDAIEALIDEKSDDEGWVFCGALGNLLIQRFPDFDVRNFGFKKFIPFVASLEGFELQQRPSGSGGVSLVYIRNKED